MFCVARQVQGAGPRVCGRSVPDHAERQRRQGAAKQAARARVRIPERHRKGLAMDFEWPAEHRLIQETTRRFIRDRLKPHEEATELADATDQDLMAKLREEASAL